MAETRNTNQKKMIYSTLCELKTHPTVNELIDELNKRGCAVGKSTVYRVLSNAVDEGRVRKICISDDEEHYDADISEHYHFHCMVCGGIFDLTTAYHKELDAEVARDTGMIIDAHSIEFRGICKLCAGKQNRRN